VIWKGKNANRADGRDSYQMAIDFASQLRELLKEAAEAEQ
jgi:hypothetical protein